MSINFLLADTPSHSTQVFSTPTVVKHLVQHKLANPLTPQQNHPLQPMNENYYLLFAILCRIILPKSSADSIALLFQKLALGKASFATVSQKIYHKIRPFHDTCNDLVNIWDSLNSKHSSPLTPLGQLILEIIQWFSAHNNPIFNAIEFISYIVSAKSHGASNIQILIHLINLPIVNSSNTATILSFTIKLIPLIPVSPLSTIYNFTRSQFGDNLNSAKQFTMNHRSIGLEISSTLGLLDFQKPFSIKKRFSDISSFTPQSRDQAIARRSEVKIQGPTPSYIDYQTELVEGKYAFYTNSIAKSRRSGREGGSHGPSHIQIAVPQTVNVHEQLERPENIEHQMDAILSFTPDFNQMKHSIRMAGIGRYGESTWEHQIEQHLENPEIRKYISSKVREGLDELEIHHEMEVHNCNVFLATRSTNAYIQSLHPVKLDIKRTFSYVGANNIVTHTLKEMILKENLSRFPSFTAFFGSLFAFIESNIGHEIKIITSQPAVHALLSFSNTCKLLVDIVNVDSINKLDTFDSVLDAAFLEIVNNEQPESLSLDKVSHGYDPFGPVLTPILKSIIKNRTILDDMAFEIEKHYGRRSILLANLVASLGDLNSISTALKIDPMWPKLQKGMWIFGAQNDELKWRMYQSCFQYETNRPLFILSINPEQNEMNVEPLLL